jgi:hypothetical protein
MRNREWSRRDAVTSRARLRAEDGIATFRSVELLFLIRPVTGLSDLKTRIRNTRWPDIAPGLQGRRERLSHGRGV